MHVILWSFRPLPGCEPAFEEAYGADGPWARLFRRDPGFLGIDLLRGSDGTYVTLDRWTSREASERFRDREAEAYADLDARFAPLVESETDLGSVEV